MQLIVENEESVGMKMKLSEIHQKVAKCFSIKVTSSGKSWYVQRNLDDFKFLDKQIHTCVFDRKYSDLQQLDFPNDVEHQENVDCSNGPKLSDSQVSS